MEGNKKNDQEKSFEDALKKKYAAVDPEVSDIFWHKLDSKLEEKNIYKTKDAISLKSRNQMTWTAAAVVSLLIVFACLVIFVKENAQKHLASDTSVQPPAKKIRVSDLQQEKETLVPLKKIMESGANNLLKKSEVLHYATKEMTREIYLPDSSKVFMNSHTKLTYVSERKVELSGEAYFEVRHNTKQTNFQIQTESAKITVLGTSFLVDCHPGISTQVTVYSGLVSMVPKAGYEKGMLLKPGITGTSTIDGVCEMKQDLDSNLLSWKENRLSFNNTPLLQVADVLERHFHTRILLSDRQLSDCTFTGTFKKPELTKILKIIGATFELQYEFKAGEYLLSGKGCK